MPLMLTRIIAPLALMAFMIAWCWWGYRTFRALWRGGETKWSRLVYGHGARGFGVVMTVIFCAYTGYCGWVLPTSSIGYHFTFAVVGAVLGAIFAFPVGLGMGWFWGTLMAATLGLEPDAKRPNRKTRRQV
jgi:hypothetical protein